MCISVARGELDPKFRNFRHLCFDRDRVPERPFPKNKSKNKHDKCTRYDCGFRNPVFQVYRS